MMNFAVTCSTDGALVRPLEADFSHVLLQFTSIYRAVGLIWICFLGEQSRQTVSFQSKNPDLLLKNPHFLLKNVDFIIKTA